MKPLFAIPLILMSLMSSPSLGADFQKGLNAYYIEDFATAVREWTPLAEQGDARAQYNLGVMYGLGNGVVKDSVYAHMWTNIASANGDENGGKVRDLVAEKMTPSQLEKAQDLARECVAKNYIGC